VTADDLLEWLGPKRFHNELTERITTPGVVTGLAWTAMGGDILFIEAADVPALGSQGGSLKLTGKMGETMTESAQIAWSVVRKKVHEELGIQGESLKTRDFHVHIPAGAIPKDGPSAGITMATALYSLLSGRKTRQKLAMTGELSLTGKVLPVGGIKEKLLAAKRAGITTVILPRLNEKDLYEVPESVKQSLFVHFVSTLDEVLVLALESPPKKVLRTGKRTSAKNRSSNRSERWLS
jgi:ATP-dependent Lon protease